MKVNGAGASASTPSHHLQVCRWSKLLRSKAQAPVGPGLVSVPFTRTHFFCNTLYFSALQFHEVTDSCPETVTIARLRNGETRDNRGLQLIWVPEKGLEPLQPFGHTPLKRARLPIPPFRHGANKMYRRWDSNPHVVAYTGF